MTADAYHMPDQIQLFCPLCQADLTLAKHAAGPVRGPVHGDCTVCSLCLQFLRYAEPEPGQLRLDALGDAEFQALAEQHQAALIQVRQELKQVLESGRSTQPTQFEAALMLEVTALKARIARLERVAERLAPYWRGPEEFSGEQLT